MKKLFLISLTASAVFLLAASCGNDRPGKKDAGAAGTVAVEAEDEVEDVSPAEEILAAEERRVDEDAIYDELEKLAAAGYDDAIDTITAIYNDAGEIVGRLGKVPPEPAE